MKLFTLDKRYNLLERYGWFARATGRLAEILKLPVKHETQEDVIARADRRTGETRVFLIPAIANRLYKEVRVTEAYNFTLKNPSPEDALGVPWYDQVQAANLDPLAFSTTFLATNRASNGEVVADSEAFLGWPSGGHIIDQFGVLSVLERFREVVNDPTRRMEARFWGMVLVNRISIAYKDRTIGCSADELLVSQPDSTGNFSIRWGFWDLERNPTTLEQPPFNPNYPRTENFVGLIFTIDDLIIAHHAMNTKLSDADVLPTANQLVLDSKRIEDYIAFMQANNRLPPAPLPDSAFNTYTPPAEVGKFVVVDFFVPSVVFQGFSFTREELGLFPSTAVTNGDGVSTLNYCPHQLANNTGSGPLMSHEIDGRVGNLFGAPHFRRFRNGGFDYTVTYEFKMHRLGRDGSLTKEDIDLPTGVGTTSSIYTVDDPINTPIDQQLNSWTGKVMFFDGEEFRVIGDLNRTPSSYVDPTIFAGDDVFIDGTLTMSGPLKRMQGAPANDRSHFSAYLKDFGFIYDTASIEDYYVPESEFTLRTYSNVYDNGLSPGNTGDDFLYDHTDGPVWGDYSFTTQPTVATEYGFWEASGNKDGDPFGSHFAFASTLIPCASVYLSSYGAIWYRRGAPPGIFLYNVTGDPSVFAADCHKYRHIYYGDIKEGDVGYENPEAILARLWGATTVFVNNFGTPRMLPWMQRLSFLVIV